MESLCERISEALPTLYKQFDVQYVPPEFIVSFADSSVRRIVCRNCGLEIYDDAIHLRWHKEFALVIWLTMRAAESSGIWAVYYSDDHDGYARPYTIFPHEEEAQNFIRERCPMSGELKYWKFGEWW